MPFWRKYLKTSSSKVCGKRVLPFPGPVKILLNHWLLETPPGQKKFLVKDKENWNFILISTDFDLAIYLPNVIPVSPSKSLSPKWRGLSGFHTYIYKGPSLISCKWQSWMALVKCSLSSALINFKLLPVYHELRRWITFQDSAHLTLQWPWPCWNINFQPKTKLKKKKKSWYSAKFVVIKIKFSTKLGNLML